MDLPYNLCKLSGDLADCVQLSIREARLACRLLVQIMGARQEQSPVHFDPAVMPKTQ